jgi:hypothetical protein
MDQLLVALDVNTAAEAVALAAALKAGGEIVDIQNPEPRQHHVVVCFTGHLASLLISRISHIETYRGCSRSITGGCSFCSEPSKGLPRFRTTAAIHQEIAALYKVGVRHFRIGNQPCIFPISVELPVFTISALPCPFKILLPAKTVFFISYNLRSFSSKVLLVFFYWFAFPS